MAKDVCCKVDTCTYNVNERCHAKSIIVNTCHCNSAEDTDQTACDTFRCK